jgi:chromosome partitioning protein
MTSWPELAGVAEIAAHNKVSSQAVTNWQQRYEDFPEPVARLRMGPVWKMDDVNEWIARHWDV